MYNTVELSTQWRNLRAKIKYRRGCVHTALTTFSVRQKIKDMELGLLPVSSRPCFSHQLPLLAVSPRNKAAESVGFDSRISIELWARETAPELQTHSAANSSNRNKEVGEKQLQARHSHYRVIIWSLKQTCCPLQWVPLQLIPTETSMGLWYA